MGICQHSHHHHPEHPGRAVPDVRTTVAEAVAKVRSMGMRRTRLLEDVLAVLAKLDRPITIAQLSDAVGGVCDPATIYRMAERLVEAGLVRKIGLHERSLFYEFVVPGNHHDYLICSSCGAIGDINAACPVEALEIELARRTGYTGLHHDLVFFGVCPECAMEDGACIAGQGR